MKVDFHIHSHHSDGALSVQQIVQLDQERELAQISITDHDTMNAYKVLEGVDLGGLQVISGCEFSCQWKGRNIHIVGLNLDLYSDAMSQAMTHQQTARENRTLLIADALEAKGFSGALSAAKKIAGDSTLGRPHFARFLVDEGYVKDEKQAFSKYLCAGKIGDIKSCWPEIEQAIGWIKGAGGIAVLAHPLKYGMTLTKLRAFLADFVDKGGQAIEVISGSGNEQARITDMARLANQFGLHASLGSDYHRPGQPWAELGFIAELPSMSKPVWKYWQ